MKGGCPFNNFGDLPTMELREISEQQGDAYIILCQHFNISDEDIRSVEDNTEENYVRLGDALHRIYHRKNLILTQEEVIKIIDRSKKRNETAIPHNFILQNIATTVVNIISKQN